MSQYQHRLHDIPAEIPWTSPKNLRSRTSQRLGCFQDLLMDWGTIGNGTTGHHWKYYPMENSATMDWNNHVIQKQLEISKFPQVDMTSTSTTDMGDVPLPGLMTVDVLVPTWGYLIVSAFFSPKRIQMCFQSQTRCAMQKNFLSTPELVLAQPDPPS